MIERYLDPKTMCDVIGLVTSVSLGFEATPVGRPEHPWGSATPRWTASVGVAGAFRGAVTVSCSKDFAYRATRAMLDTDTVDDAGVRDALGELVNVIGGNIKSLLASVSGEHASLSIPTVTVGSFEASNATTIHEQWCEVAGDIIVVTLLESAATEGAKSS